MMYCAIDSEWPTRAPAHERMHGQQVVNALRANLTINKRGLVDVLDALPRFTEQLRLGILLRLSLRLGNQRLSDLR